MKKINVIHDLLRDPELTKKVKLFFSTKVAGSDYDDEEKNYTFTALNPLTIKALVRNVSPEALVWKQYGLSQMGAVELIAEKRYQNWFLNCFKIEIDDKSYAVYRDGSGNRAIIQERSNDLIRVVLMQK